MRRAACLPAIWVLFCVTVHAALYAQETSSSSWGHTLVVIPFEDESPGSGHEWLNEGFAEALRWQLDSPVLYVATREERLRAYDRLGIPAGLHPSRATLYRLAEQMDVDYAVLGSYRIEGEKLRATVQLLDMRATKLRPTTTETAPVADFGGLHASLAWDMLRQIHADFDVPKEKYLASAEIVRADGLEAYVRGISAVRADEKVAQFREAVRLSPAFAQAWLELGKVYLEDKAYAPAAVAFEKVQPSAGVAREANFYLGLSSYAIGDFARAQRAFEFVAARLPLAEVYNNLGVVAARLGEKKAINDFERAIENDPSDADYHFNLGVALGRAGEKTKAAHEARVALERRPDDAEARVLLDSVTAGAASIGDGAEGAKLPAERLKRNYEESAFRQMMVQMQSWTEQQFARSDARSHARYHVVRGKELLAHGFTSEAEREFRHAAAVDPTDTAPLTALAELYDVRGDGREARSEAEASLRLRESVDAYLLLTRLDLREDRTDSAGRNIDRALQMDPGNLVAQDLKRTLAAKLGEKAQP